MSKASADEINRAAQERAARAQAKADFVSMPLDALNSAGAWLDIRFTNLAGHIDASWAGEWIGNGAEWIVQGEQWVDKKTCAAYNYCINELQELLPNSDVERMLNGSGLILVGGFKLAGGVFLTLAGASTSCAGIGFAGMAAGTVTGMAGISDIDQGINEIKLGWENDSTTQTRNLVRDILYDGNDTIYHLSTGTAAIAGMVLKPYVMPKQNPVPAGGEQENIAEKAAMGADGAAEGVEGSTPINKIPENDSIIKHIFKDATGHIPDTPENRALLEEIANNAENFRGIDRYGNEWYTRILEDGREVWVESRNGNIFEGGINEIPKPWNPETGLKINNPK